MIFAPQAAHLPGHQRRQQGRQRGIQPEQQRVVLREQRGIAAGGSEQEQQHARERGAEDDQQPHFASASFASLLSTGAGELGAETAGGRKMKRFHGDSRFSSRLVMALS